MEPLDGSRIAFVNDRQPCDSLWELLMAYADGEATDDEALLVERHLSVCSECRHTLDVLRSLDAHLASDAVPAPPPDLRDRILRATVSSACRRDGMGWAARAQLRPAIGTALVVALFGYLWGGSLTRTTRAPWIPPPNRTPRPAEMFATAPEPAIASVEPIRVYEVAVRRGSLASRHRSQPLTTLVVAPTAQPRFLEAERTRPATPMAGAPAVEEPARSLADGSAARPMQNAPAVVRAAQDPSPAAEPALASRTVSGSGGPDAVSPSAGAGATTRLVSSEPRMGPDMMVSLAALRHSLDTQEGLEPQKARLNDVVRPERREVKVEVSIGHF